MKKIALGIVLAGFSTLGLASGCDNPSTPYDRTYCAALMMVQEDKSLNEEYKKTQQVLNVTQKQSLKDAQIRWIKARDEACSDDGVVEVDCVNSRMSSRIETLKAIQRECGSVGCDDRKISSDQ